MLTACRRYLAVDVNKIRVETYITLVMKVAHSRRTIAIRLMCCVRVYDHYMTKQIKVCMYIITYVLCIIIRVNYFYDLKFFSKRGGRYLLTNNVFVCSELNNIVQFTYFF